MDSTQHILAIFERLSAIPRGSGHEAQVSSWLQELARESGYTSQVDEAGNLVIRVPASPGYESAPVIVLQGHMDMVCEKTPDSNHDFSKDPIRCIVEGDWLHADKTTLGADNGIAIALSLALADEPALSHPALELLFTVQEEVGLGGANLLKPGFITGKILLNLDSEDEGTFIIGCAGGQVTHINLVVHFAKIEQGSGFSAFNLKVSGLRGGHSGVDIHKHYASANQLLGRVLAHLQKITPLSLLSAKGGTAHNAISRESQASFACEESHIQALRNAVKEFEIILNNEYSPIETNITLTLTSLEPDPAARFYGATTEDTAQVIHLWSALPHGVAQMSASVKGFVETSNNLANVDLDQKGFRVLTSQRSTVMSRMEELTSRITAIAQLSGAEVNSTPAYPGWQPDMNSPMLTRSVQIYKNIFESDPEVRMIHAGLECGTIGAIYPGMDMISLGVTIENPHSPNERMYIPSIERVWKFLGTFVETVK